MTAIEQDSLVVIVLARPPFRIELWHVDARLAAQDLYEQACRQAEAGQSVDLRRLGLPHIRLTPGEAKTLAAEMFQAAHQADAILGERWTLPEADLPTTILVDGRLVRIAP